MLPFYKYVSKRLYDQSFMLCIQIINNMEMYRGVSTIRRTFNCKVFTASQDERNIFEVLLNNDINN